jgi:hypothetical protein
MRCVGRVQAIRAYVPSKHARNITKGCRSHRAGNGKGPMRAEDETLIRVQRDWDGWRTGEVRLGDLQSVHWFQPSRAPRPLVHGYISCASIVTGDIPHDCHLSEAPHRLLVCILKSHTVPRVYVELARRADEQRISSPNGCAGPVGAGDLRDRRTSGG